ncbi:MAG TPA: OmpA family protein, partial [Gammaproteobacteria bacterium]
DERGSREYNLALGERRSRAIEQVMTLQGAQKRQLQVVSFGEERPAAMGHDDEAWRQNRRVELVYNGR